VHYAKIIGQQQEMIEKLQNGGSYAPSTNASEARLLMDDSIATMNQTNSSVGFGAESDALNAFSSDYGYVRRNYGGANPYRALDSSSLLLQQDVLNDRGSDEQRIASLRAEINNATSSAISPEAASIPTF